MKESKYKKELAEFDVEKAYKTEEVMDLLKKQPKRNFTESVDVAVKSVSYTHLTLPTKA